MNLQINDRVKYARHFLKNLGCLTDEEHKFYNSVGTIKDIKRFNLFVIAVVDFTGKEVKVAGRNLTKYSETLGIFPDKE